MEKTSITDNGVYPEFCYIASKHDEVFQNFKSHPMYRYIVEGVSAEQGRDYLEIILNHSLVKLTSNQWKIFLQNDLCGNPLKITYTFGDSSITCSPCTLRYVKVMSDILSLFDSEKIKKVAEIGVGYAGQCRILMNMLPIDEYNLIDLPEVLSLSERCLNELNSNRGGAVRYIDGTHLYHDVESDLLISNYAFSELSRQAQDVYLEKVVLKAKSGYITWNDFSARDDNLKAYTLEEILSIIPNSYTIPEKPLTFEWNCIIVWGTK